MRPRHLISLAFVVVLVAMGVWSFYGNVLNPHASGDPMEGMAMSDDGGGSPSGDTAPNITTTSAGGSPSAIPADADMVPGSLGGRPLASVATGDEARAQVEQLHGKSLGPGLEAAWVAQYGAASGSGHSDATLWISRSATAGDARVLFELMTKRISEGTSPFEGLRPINMEGVEGYALDGMGQRHYYFLVDRDLYWLATAPGGAEVVLAEMLANAQRAATAG